MLVLFMLFYSYFIVFLFNKTGLSFIGVVVNLLDCDLIEWEFDLQSTLYVHFQTDGKGTNSHHPPAIS